MNYYRVSVANSKYHGDHSLTYQSADELLPGTLVEVPLQRQIVLGFIVESATKPSFTARDIRRSFTDVPPLPKPYLKLHQWMAGYYPAPLGITTQLFVPKSIPTRDSKKVAKTTTKPSVIDLPPLTKEQQKTISSIDAPGSYLLYGETGSGKTRVYIELAQRAMQAGKSSVILTPEISLTSQLSQSFARVFNTKHLVILHSQLTEAERRTIWLRLLSNEHPFIVIGPRSALFSPLASIGLIAIDEAHEFTYKQENAPHYHASRVASKLANLHQAQLILGSATPSVEDYFVMTAKQRPILRMEHIAATTKSNPVDVTVVDMRNRDLLSRDSYLSTPLLQKITETLAAKQQVLLFINRRGTARIVLCDNCGWQAVCPHCDLPLTYHHDTHTLRCHSCNHSEPARSSCPVCDNTDITLKSIGTKSIEASVRKLFPSARAERFDTDSKKGERLNEVYDDIHSGDIDILIGTQMLVKGLDLPKLGLVGVINADASLYIPDFTSQEKTYQLLYQIIGRVGRGHQAKTAAVIQSYTPDNPTIHAAIKKDWSTFYERELHERAQFLFPPHCFLLKATVKRSSVKSVQAAAEKVADELRAKQLEVVIEGPAPAFHEKIQNKYVWQLVIKAKQRSELLKIIKLLPRDWSYDIDPINLL